MHEYPQDYVHNEPGGDPLESFSSKREKFRLSQKENKKNQRLSMPLDNRADSFDSGVREWTRASGLIDCIFIEAGSLVVRVT